MRHRLLKWGFPERWPCICTPVAVDNNLKRGACTISVYAGASLDSGSACEGLSNEQLLHKARQLAATLLMVQEVFENVVSDTMPC
jgi:hypothetical protein